MFIVLLLTCVVVVVVMTYSDVVTLNNYQAFNY